MAGNGEACSHVAALLFYIEYGVRVQKERSCTDGANSWLPTHIKKVDVRPIAAIDFAQSTIKKRCLGDDVSATCEPKALAQPAAPTRDEWMCLFTALVDSGQRPAVARTDPAFSDFYVPAVRRCKGADLRRLYSHSARSLSYHELLEECHNIYESLDINEEADCSIESRTRSQHMTTWWFTYDYSVVHSYSEWGHRVPRAPILMLQPTVVTSFKVTAVAYLRFLVASRLQLFAVLQLPTLPLPALLPVLLLAFPKH